MLRQFTGTAAVTVLALLFSGCAASRYALECVNKEMPIEHTGLQVSVEGSGTNADDEFTPGLCPVYFWVKISNPTSEYQVIRFSTFRLVLDNGAELVPDGLPGSVEPGVRFPERLRRIRFIQAGVEGDVICLAEDCVRTELDGLPIEAVVNGSPLILPGHECRFRIVFNAGEPVEKCTLTVHLGRPVKKLELDWRRAGG